MIPSEPLKRGLKLLALSLFFLCAASPLLALDKEQVAANAAYFGLWTLIPPVLAIALAFITARNPETVDIHIVFTNDGHPRRFERRVFDEHLSLCVKLPENMPFF